MPPGARVSPPEARGGAPEAARGGAPGASEAARGGAGLALLPRDFFGRAAVAVAPALLGCVLEHETPGGVVAAMLTEVEAYAGEADAASHAYRGPTRRNAVMFGAPGHAYVYFTYGMHFCVNLVCMPEGTACAVLLRSGVIGEGTALARQRRSEGHGSAGPNAGRLPDRDLARGPARLCKALGIDRRLDGADVCHPGSALRIRAAAGPPGSIARGPRVGVSAAASA